MTPNEEWMNGTCEACEGGIGKEGLETILEALENLSGWEYDQESDELKKTFTFKNFHQTMAFVNAVALGGASGKSSSGNDCGIQDLQDYLHHAQRGRCDPE